jgi:uncharacterized protein YceK
MNTNYHNQREDARDQGWTPPVRKDSTRTRIILIAVAVALLSLTGCATIINGSHQTVPVTSTPAGAIITDNGTAVGRTPAKLELARKLSHFVVVELAGYAPCETTLVPHWSSVVLGNLLLGGLIGDGVDAATGSYKRLVPKKVQCVMVPVTP